MRLGITILWALSFFISPFGDALNSKAPLKYCAVDWMGENKKSKDLGADIEIAEAFGKYLNRPVVHVEVKWPQLFEKSPGITELGASYTPYLLQGACEFYASSMTVTPWRTGLLNIVPLYAGRPMVVVLSEKRNQFVNISSLKGKTTAVIKGTTFADWLESTNESLLENKIQITEYDKINTTELLLDEKVDFILLDTIQALLLMNKRDVKKVSMAFPAGANERIGWGFRNKDSDLAKKFQSFLEQQKKNPNSDLNKIFKKYFGVTVHEFDTLVFSSVGS